MNLAPLLLLLPLTTDSAGFAPRPAGPGVRRRRPRAATCLHHSGDAPPFSEAEGPRDRARRMEMARELQKVFYKNPEPSPSVFAQMLSEQPSKSNYLVCGSTSLHDLPTITTNDGIKGANESSILPGYQFVWDVHDPLHCHMFHSILAGPAPWCFAHLHVPRSSTSGSEVSEDGVWPGSFQSYRDIQTELKYGSSLYGTLMRITDRRFRDEDGKIVIAVQALERIRVCDVRMAAYLRTDAQFSPEEELISLHFDKAFMSSASCLAGRGDEAGLDENKAEPCSTVEPTFVNAAARSAAAAEALLVRRFEYMPIFLEERPRRSRSAVFPRPGQKDSEAAKKIEDVAHQQDKAKGAFGPEYVDVSLLVNYDAFAYSSLANAHSTTSQAIKNYWEHVTEDALRLKSTGDNWHDIGSASSEPPSSSFLLPEPPRLSSRPLALAKAAEAMECEVWRSLDEMIRLLSLAAKATVPLPSQLLGLLPKRNDWPHQFVLEDYAKSLSTPGNTAFKSPFVRIDQIRLADPVSYPPIRRARRLSYVIWLLLDGLAVAGGEFKPPPRHEILAMESVEQRLGAAGRTLKGLNSVLKRMIPENRKDNEK